MKDVLRSLFAKTLEEVELDGAMRRLVSVRDHTLVAAGEEIPLAPFKKILTIAIGKAAHRMATTFADIVSPSVASGVVVSSVEGAPPPYFLSYQGGHPYPNAESFHAAAVVEEMLSDLKPHHLVVYLLSGGGSAICERPITDAISPEDVEAFFRALVTGGADIVAMNVLRKHFSAIKGGRLAARAHPARQLTLYVSDVPADQPSSVASGPTMPDESSVEDCYALAEHLGLRGNLPTSIEKFFTERLIEETPKPGDPAFENSSWHCLIDNQAALAALERAAAAEGWVTETDLSIDDEPIDAALDVLLARLDKLKAVHPDGTVAVLTGGELSCPVTGDGRGGRNQHFVLRAAKRIAGRDVSVLSAGTDGIDGVSPAAGAAADGETIARAAALGLDAEDFDRRSDSFTFFDRLGDAVVTGPTGNNVRDVRLLVAR